MSTDLNQLRSLPIGEKLRLVEQLWDDIGQSEERLIVRDWHKKEAQNRAAEIDAGQDVTITREELWKRVDETNG